MATDAVVPNQGAAETKSFWSPPNTKVGTGALAGAITTLLVATAKAFHGTWVNDAAVVAAITSLLTFVVQYLVPEKT